MLEVQLWLLVPVGLCHTVERKYLAKGNGLSSESQIKIICTVKNNLFHFCVGFADENLNIRIVSSNWSHCRYQKQSP